MFWIILGKADQTLTSILDTEKTRQAAEAANRTKSDFLANMSHEIRTPITVILGFSENLLDRNLFDSEKFDAVHLIQRNSKNLLNIINDILELSKIEAGKMDAERISCDPCQIIAEVASLERVQAAVKGLSFNIEYTGNIPHYIQSDPTRLHQILLNLLRNAIKFTEAGFVRLVTQFVNYGDDSLLKFEIIDTGQGMTKEQMDKLFVPFTQADTSTTRKFGGTGLGLTISKRLAVLLGGDVEVVHSQAGAGTTVRATIATGSCENVKMLKDPMSATVVIDACAVENASPLNLQGCRIQLAEDAPDNQHLISFILNQVGADGTVVENGKIAIDRTLDACEEGKPFDII